MLKIEMNNTIIVKHAQYIVSRNTKSKLQSFIANHDYNQEIIHNKGHIFFQQHILMMLNLILNALELESIKYDTNLKLYTKNIFIAPPSILDFLIENFENDYPNVIEELKNEDEFIVKYRENIIDLLGYNDFIRINKFDRTEDYKIKQLFLEFKKNKINILIKKNKVNVNTSLYNQDDYTNLIEFYVNEINKLLNSPPIISQNQILIRLKKDLDSCKNHNYSRKKDFIDSIYSIAEKYICEYKNNTEYTYIDIKKYSDKNLVDSNHWSAYHYVFQLGVKVCPYCNRQYITPLYTEDGKVRGDIDHFFSKSKYPYLSMSVFNLIPCCRFCNSSLKLDKEFTYKDNLNPFEYGISDVLQFDFIPESYLSFYGNDDIEISFIDRNIELSHLSHKANKNSKIFKLKELYQYHSDVVKKIIFKRVLYSDTYLEKLCNDHNDIIKSKEEALDFLLYQNLDSNDLDNALSILVKDAIKWVKDF